MATFGFIGIGNMGGAIAAAAAGQAAGDGHAEDFVRIAKGRQPVLGIRAGSLGFAFVTAEVIDHGFQIQCGIIHELPFCGDDLQGCCIKCNALEF